MDTVAVVVDTAEAADTVEVSVVAMPWEDSTVAAGTSVVSVVGVPVAWAAVECRLEAPDYRVPLCGAVWAVVASPLRVFLRASAVCVVAQAWEACQALAVCEVHPGWAAEV